MVYKRESGGFEEVAHTADWALKVWSERLSGLFVQAAQGMYSLMDLGQAQGPRLECSLQLSAVDTESLLVAFLTELLYLLERDRTAYDRIRVELKEGSLEADLSGLPVLSQKKEIKAVTYHNLRIDQSGERYETTIVFDV